VLREVLGREVLLAHFSCGPHRPCRPRLRGRNRGSAYALHTTHE
jgi:hypothetical protein